MSESESAVAQTPTNAQNMELNVGDQFIFALDVSGSMATKDCPGGLSRIEFAKDQARTFAKKAGEFDPDGADYYTFGHEIKEYLNMAPDRAVELISGLQATGASTDTAGVITRAWERAKQLRANGVTDNIVLMVVTDGEPNSREEVKTVIRNIAASLTNGEEFGIVFLTVGTIDAGLRSFLTDLDDTLNAAHDIVDVKDLNTTDFETAFAGAIHD